MWRERFPVRLRGSVRSALSVLLPWLPWRERSSGPETLLTLTSNSARSEGPQVWEAVWLGPQSAQSVSWFRLSWFCSPRPGTLVVSSAKTTSAWPVPVRVEEGEVGGLSRSSVGIRWDFVKGRWSLLFWCAFVVTPLPSWVDKTKKNNKQTEKLLAGMVSVVY